MRIVIASDHAGFPLKELIREYLEERFVDVQDFGAFSDERSDYPDFAKKVAGAVSEGKAAYGILICGSGIGMCMSANRFKGIRAAVLRDSYDAQMSRKHNDANVACLGARITNFNLAKNLIDEFLSTSFEGGRHTNRVKKIEC